MNILQSDNEFRIFNSVKIIGTLPPGVYHFESSKTGPYLIQSEPLRTPEKVYSNDLNFIEHVTRTWKETSLSLGILLTGKKGLGKSFTANLLCLKLGENLPVIKITREIYKQEGLIEFLNEIKQEHVIYIDEFEKIFEVQSRKDEDMLEQKVFLSYLDGANTSNIRRLFIITTNTEVDDLFLNRPSRLRYIREYEFLHIDIIREIIEDRLVNKEFLEDLISNLEQDSINIDILIKIIDEINIHNVPYSTFKEFFNYQTKKTPYDVLFQHPTTKEFCIIDSMDSYYLNQLSNRIRTSYGFSSHFDKSVYYNLIWSLGKHGVPKRIDSVTYELKVTCTPENEEDEPIGPPFETTLILRQELKRLIY